MFSVIMPVYNGEKFTDSAVKSVLAQTETDWELIIIDDGSTDGTPALLEKYGNNEKIHIITQKNQGVSAARNNGAAIASGEYFAFLDADDIWFENHLEVLKELISKYPSAGLYCTFAKVELKNGKVISECEYFNGLGGDICLDDFFEEYVRDKSAKMFAMSSTCVSREAFERIGGFPRGCAMGEDLELSLTAAAYYPVALSGKCTAAYRAVNSAASKYRSFDPDWHFFDSVKLIYADGSVPGSKKENLKKLMGWFTMRRCRHYITEGEKKKALRTFFHTDRRFVRRADTFINLALLLLPCALVRRIFEIRWKGKA